MPMQLATVVLAASVAAAPAAQPSAVVIPENWAAAAAAPVLDEQLIKRAVEASIEAEKALVVEQSKAAAIPQRYSAGFEPESTKYERFAEQFDDAKVPGCLRPDGLKRQSTFIFGSLLAIPFMAVAKIRGKCN